MTEKHYAHYLKVQQMFALDWACRGLWDAFGDIEGLGGAGIYLVGSVLHKRDWRDVDVVMMLPDNYFEQTFGGNEMRLCLMNAAMSEWLSARTGLPVDFKFQDHTKANKQHGGKPRNALIQCKVWEMELREGRRQEVLP